MAAVPPAAAQARGGGGDARPLRDGELLDDPIDRALALARKLVRMCVGAYALGSAFIVPHVRGDELRAQFAVHPE